MKRIQLISGPRNISTALMYSFANRRDTAVVDEPFYGHYLSNDEVDHPGKKEIIESMSCDLGQILEKEIFGYLPKEIMFIKNMAHHYLYVDHSILHELENVFLIRNLKKLIVSFSKVIPNPTIQDIGIKIEYDLFMYLKNKGKSPIVLDADELLEDPKFVLKNLCNSINIPFTERMLKWSFGPRVEDGIWAKYWYKNVHLSTGFKKKDNKCPDLKNNLLELYQEALPYYNELYFYAIKAPTQKSL